jgi:hypothetical protein
MPNVDFERRLVATRLATVMDAPDFERKLLTVKAIIDYQDEDILRLNFMDTLRPELWCIEGLARQLDPLPGRQYGLDLVESLPKVAVDFVNTPREKTSSVLHVEVDANQAIVDDGYFFKKVRDQIGFGSRQNIDVFITPGMQQEISSRVIIDEDSEALPSLVLEPGMNTVVFTALDQRINAWLCFTFLCNYLDRGYKLHGIAFSAAGKELFARWDAFTISAEQISKTLGFQPDQEQFGSVLRSQHYETYYDASTHTWYITPPIFRFDIIHTVDIVEDYLVVTHYDEVKPTPVTSLVGMGSQTKRNALEEKLVDYMQAYGARQTIGLLLDSYDNVVKYMRRAAPERLIRLANAVNKNREYIVDSSLAPLLRNAVHPSAPLPPATSYLFTETASLDEQSIAHSRWKMGILLIGTDHPFNNAHTLLDALCYHLRLSYTLTRSASPELIPGRQMLVTSGDIPIGQFGEVHPEVLANWELFYPASFIELDVDTITGLWGGNDA